jgi:hypothetical protein
MATSKIPAAATRATFHMRRQSMSVPASCWRPACDPVRTPGRWTSTARGPLPSWTGRPGGTAMWGSLGLRNPRWRPSSWTHPAHGTGRRWRPGHWRTGCWHVRHVLRAAGGAGAAGPSSPPDVASWAAAMSPRDRPASPAVPAAPGSPMGIQSAPPPGHSTGRGSLEGVLSVMGTPPNRYQGRDRDEHGRA